MQLIADLEGTTRGPYAGCVGYFSFESLTENSKARCFRAGGWIARRDEGEYPWWVFD